jgi:hypothetical protein
LGETKGGAGVGVVGVSGHGVVVAQDEKRNALPAQALF